MGSDSEFDTEYNTVFNGRLELIIGNMFSGKSTELIRRINREKSINKKIIVINYSEDNRYSSNSIATHDQTKVNCLKLKKLSEFDPQFINQYDSFFIDEGQFFPDLYIFVKNLVDNKFVKAFFKYCNSGTECISSGYSRTKHKFVY